MRVDADRAGLDLAGERVRDLQVARPDARLQAIFGVIGEFRDRITTTDFMNNSAGFMAAVDVLGPNMTGEVAGTGTLSSVPEPSTWAMMLIGFAGLAYAGYRKTKRAALSVA